MSRYCSRSILHYNEFMSWLVLAILFEVSGTICMKLSDGFNRLGPSISMFILYMLSFACLNFALKSINISLAYAIWAGVGTTLIAIIGVIWFNEPINFLKTISISLVVIGVVGINLTTSQ